ncbi:MAG: transposase, partial [Cellulosilyticaceae bacterium]
MNQLATQQQEIETLKSQLKAKDVQIASLEKLNGWYLEQLKLRRQKQFGASSEKCSEDQIAIDDLFADLFNEAWQVNQSNATAKEGESYIQKLFAIEAQADQLKYTDSQRLELRKTESKKTLDEFYTWIDKISPKTLPQSLLGKAITYAQNQKVYLSNFLKDGRIQLSNNLAEQSIKMFVIGRKNWLFSNTQNGA